MGYVQIFAAKRVSPGIKPGLDQFLHYLKYSGLERGNMPSLFPFVSEGWVVLGLDTRCAEFEENKCKSKKQKQIPISASLLADSSG